MVKTEQRNFQLSVTHAKQQHIRTQRGAGRWMLTKHLPYEDSPQAESAEGSLSAYGHNRH